VVLVSGVVVLDVVLVSGVVVLDVVLVSGVVVLVEFSENAYCGKIKIIIEDRTKIARVNLRWKIRELPNPLTPDATPVQFPQQVVIQAKI